MTPCQNEKAIDIILDDVKEIKSDMKDFKKSIDELIIFREVKKGQVLVLSGVISGIITILGIVIKG